MEEKTKETTTGSTSEVTAEPAAETDKKKKSQKQSIATIVEILIVVMLGITALCTAWASWIGSLHGGNQATNYAKSNNIAAEGNSEYNAAIQQLSNDQQLWNDISDLQFEILFAKDKNDQAAIDKSSYILYYKLNDNLSDSMAKKIGWTENDDDQDPTEVVNNWLQNEKSLQSPFDDEFVSAYFDKANQLLAESQDVLKQGQTDNAHGDAFGLVTVLYSITLFLLGISSSFSKQSLKNAILIISVITFVIATIYMFTIPMPTGFDIMSFFGK